MSLPPAVHSDEAVMSMPPGAAMRAPALEATVSGAAVSGSVPAPGPSVVKQARSRIEEVTPQELEKILAEHFKEWAASNYGKKPGFPASTMIVQFTSHDPACQQCIAAIAKLDELVATAPPDKRIRLVRVTWEPWQSAAHHPIIKWNVIDAFPTTMQFVMGMRRSRIVGDAEPKVFFDFLWKFGSAEMPIDWRASRGSWLPFKNK